MYSVYNTVERAAEKGPERKRIKPTARDEIAITEKIYLSAAKVKGFRYRGPEKVVNFLA